MNFCKMGVPGTVPNSELCSIRRPPEAVEAMLSNSERGGRLLMVLIEVLCVSGGGTNPDRDKARAIN